MSRFGRPGSALRWLFGCVAVVLCAVTAQAAPDAPSPAAAPAPLRFSITYDPSIMSSYTGRVYVLFSRAEHREPRLGPVWFSTEPFFALDIKDWKPDAPLICDDQALAFPALLSAVPRQEWSVQAVMRRNPDSLSIGEAAGDAYSPVHRAALAGDSSGTVPLRITQVVEAERFEESDRIKLVELRSERLSRFHNRDIAMRAAVILPTDYAQQPDRRYPAMYWIGGFGSDHHAARMMSRIWDSTGEPDAIVRVVLDPTCFGGNHVFADSENNGPVGTALVRELIPHLEQTFRLTADPAGRFLSGHSSGGWSSLWLQITHPDVFGGVWSIAPDPVDFRDFQRINLYDPTANMYVDDSARRRPIARHGDRVVGWYDDFARMEIVYGDGGQLRSFEWVFSPRGRDGKPQMLFDRQTGAVRPAVAEAWKRYDIRLILEQNWPRLKDKLAGKLHVFAGELDTFYLEGAVRLLKESLERLGSDAVIEIVPEKDHSSVATPALRKRIDRELLTVFEKKHAAPAAESSR